MSDDDKTGNKMQLMEQQDSEVKRILNQDNLYELLQLGKDCTNADIKKAFHAIILKIHPDKARHIKDSELAFQKVVKARAILSNPQWRKGYDSEGLTSPPDFDYKRSEDEYKKEFYKKFRINLRNGDRRGPPPENAIPEPSEDVKAQFVAVTPTVLNILSNVENSNTIENIDRSVIDEATKKIRVYADTDMTDYSGIEIDSLISSASVIHTQALKLAKDDSRRNKKDYSKACNVLKETVEKYHYPEEWADANKKRLKIEDDDDDDEEEEEEEESDDDDEGDNDPESIYTKNGDRILSYWAKSTKSELGTTAEHDFRFVVQRPDLPERIAIEYFFQVGEEEAKDYLESSHKKTYKGSQTKYTKADQGKFQRILGVAVGRGNSGVLWLKMGGKHVVINRSAFQIILGEEDASDKVDEFLDAKKSSLIWPNRENVEALKILKDEKRQQRLDRILGRPESQQPQIGWNQPPFRWNQPPTSMVPYGYASRSGRRVQNWNGAGNLPLNPMFQQAVGHYQTGQDPVYPSNQMQYHPAPGPGYSSNQSQVIDVVYLEQLVKKMVLEAIGKPGGK